MFRQVKSKEEYDALLKEYTTQKDKVKGLLLNKKLSRSKLALELKENEISKLVALDQLKQEEIYKNSLLAKQETIETSNNPIDLSTEEEKTQEQEAPAPKQAFYYETIENERGGKKYNFFENGNEALEINVNKRGVMNARDKYTSLKDLDNDYFKGEEGKNKFINKITFVPRPRRGSSQKKRPTQSGEGHKKDDMTKLNLLIGSYLSGNDNIKLKKELIVHIKKMFKNKILTKSQYNLLMSKI